MSECPSDPSLSGPPGLVVRWAGQEIPINGLGPADTVATLKEAIQAATGVRTHRQKLLNLKHKGKAAGDEVLVCDLSLKRGFKVMMMGSLEEDIAEAGAVPDDASEVINDLGGSADDDQPGDEEEEAALEKRQEHIDKIARRVREYQPKMLGQPRPGKKLLVLDIDYTLFDHRSTAQSAAELMRPFLHEFLTSAYLRYDLAIWSATSMRWIEEKMRLLGVSSNAQYSLLMFMDAGAMISVHTSRLGVVQCKPLGVIWGQYSGVYTAANTVMVDDVRHNFLMNRRNGLRIRAFRRAHRNRQTDRQLPMLAKYLGLIADEEDFSKLDHSRWEKVVRERHPDPDGDIGGLGS